MVSGTGRSGPELNIFAQHSEQNTLCRPPPAQHRFPPRLNQNIVHSDTADDKEYQMS